MRRLRKFLCVIILLSIVFSSGQVQARSRYIVNKYTKDCIDVQIASPDEDGYIMNYIRNKNKYSVALELKGYRNFPLFIKAGDMLKAKGDEGYEIASVRRISTNTYNKNYKKMYKYAWDCDIDFGMGIDTIHPHQHFTVKEGIDYDKLHKKQVKEYKELNNKLIEFHFDSNPYFYTKEGKPRKRIYNEGYFGIHSAKVSDIQLCYKYDKDNSLMPRNKKNFKPFIYIETKAVKDKVWMGVEVIAYDKGNNIIGLYTDYMKEGMDGGVGAKGYCKGYKIKYPSKMASFDIVSIGDWMYEQR